MAITDDTHVSDNMPISGMHHWYVIHCKSGKERVASEILREKLGLIVYVPERKTWHKGNVRHIPLFPGYFFIKADLQKTALSRINTTSGVLRLLECEGIPQAVPSHFIETVREETARLNEHSDRGFRPGDTLHVINGPLRGLETIFVGPTTPGKRRVQVLLNFLGRLTKTEVEADTLEKSTNTVRPRRVRYTRGKGRRIRSA
jgi:transcription elongation factor/antiterminator RfaH